MDVENADAKMSPGRIFSSKPDAELLELLACDSQAAFDALYSRYKSRLHLFCVLLLKSPTVAQDIVQEVFITVWVSRKTLNTGQSFSNYLYTLAKNRSLNELRSAKRKTSFEDIMALKANSHETETVETKLILKEYESMLEKAIQQLSEHKRNIYIMSRNEGLSHKEIAEKLNLSPHTVQSHISDSLRSISNYFLAHGDMELYLFFMVFCMEGAMSIYLT